MSVTIRALLGIIGGALLVVLLSAPEVRAQQPTVPDASCGAVPDSNGVMGPCQREAGIKPPPPRDCQTEDPERWSTGENECRASGGGLLRHGETRHLFHNDPTTSVRGSITLTCNDGTLTRQGPCSRIVMCHGPVPIKRKDGRIYWWSASISGGARADVTAPDGTKVRLECGADGVYRTVRAW